ncbi:MAG: DUF2889 domain-containing protein [Rhodospirillaceae bacterium]|nr:DUF2889 domain-containing protein [Rhodospirillaceae bacterium]
MPLPEPTARKFLHRRTIVCRGYERADGAFDVDSSVEDMKPQGTPLSAIPVGPGDIVHGMSLRITVDAGLTLTEVHAVTDHAPFEICGTITPNFRKLTGLKLIKGFTKSVRELVGGIQGCVHIVDLIGHAATVTYQTMGRKRRQEALETKGVTVKPALLNTCHAWATDSPVVKREFPKFYTGAE